MNSGIYKISCSANAKFYIGSAKNFNVRWSNHKSMLKRNCHGNRHLQHTWNKYGEDIFKFDIIEYCNIDKLIEREQFYIDNLKPTFNIAKVAGNTLGVLHSKESKLKISKAKTGIKLTIEHKNKISQVNKGKIFRLDKKHSKEEIAKRAAACRKLDKWPHEKGNKCNCPECNAKHSLIRKLKKAQIAKMLNNAEFLP